MPRKGPNIIVIGTSAGGLEALDALIASVITAKAANDYHFKTGHSTSVRDRFLYSFGVN